MPGDAPVATVLYVCTANICRSPMAERLAGDLLSRRIGAGAGRIQVTSAGVMAYDGQQMNPASADVLRSRGIGADRFGSRLLRPEHVLGATLVLAATREHRAAAARLVPQAAGRCFTVREFDRYAAAVDSAGLAGTDNATRLAELLARVARLRGTLPPVTPADDDVADPYQLGPSVMRDCAEQIAGCSRRWVDLVAPPI